MSRRHSKGAAPAITRYLAVANDELAVLKDERSRAEHLRSVGLVGIDGDVGNSPDAEMSTIAETEQPGSGIAEVARRYEVSRGLLWNWRSQVRRGALRSDPPPVFLPVQTISEPVNGHDTKHMALSAGSGAEQVTGSKIEITLPDGTSVKVGHDVGLTMLRRVMAVLR